MAIRVTVWNEYRHEKEEARIGEIYPEGIHGCVKNFLSEDKELEVRTATLEQEECGLTDEILNNTDVLMWWGHVAHAQVPDALVEKIYNRVVNGGMGFIAMHSAHFSKPFRRLCGTPCSLMWGRNQKAVVWNLLPSHPIAAGIPLHFQLEEEMYGEPFAIPTPDELIFGTWFEEGNIFRGGATWYKGLGKVVYFHPGHEECRSFYNKYVQQVLRNAVHWAAPAQFGEDCTTMADHHQTEPIVQ